MATRMQQRRGTAAQWTEVNPTLSAGEIGFETDTNRFKLGDDVNAWEDLPYFLNIEDILNGGQLDDYVLAEEVGVSIATLVNGKVPASELDLTSYALTSEVTTAVNTAVSGLIDGAPDLLNTLNELAAAVADDEDFSNTIISQLSTKISETSVGLTVASLDVTGRVPESQLFYAIDHADSQIDEVLTTTLVPLDSRVGTVEQLKQDKVAGVSDSEIATLSDIDTATTVQSQLDLKADASELSSKADASHTHSTADITGLSATASELNVLDGATVSTTELNYVDGVTSAIQDQLDAKADSSHTHLLEDITDVTTTASEVNILDGATLTTAELNILDGVTLTTEELNYVDGVTSGIQGQIDAKAALSHTHSLVDVTDVTATATEVNHLSGASSNIQNQLTAKAASVHTHTLSEITDITVDPAAINSLDGVQGNVQDQLDDKSDLGHTHTLSEVVDVTASFTEVNHLVGVTSGLQNQIDAKQDEITGAASSIVSADLTADRALVAGGGGKIAVSGVSKSELEHLTGVTSAIQTQLNGKTATGHTHEISDISGLIDVTASQINFLGGAFPVTSAIQPQLNGKASSSHTHIIEDVTGLETELDSKLNLSGGTMTGKIILDGDPTQALHAVTKEYVDNVSAGIISRPQVLAATTSNLDATYNNGSSGIGATLTSNATGAFPLIDGVALTTVNGQRGLLVKNQTTAAHNGRYNLTTQGDENTAWVLTRCSLCDQSSEVPGSYTFVLDGDSNSQTGWVQYVADPATFVIGTDSILVFQFSGSGTITAGTNISVTGNQVSTVASPTFSDATVSGTLTLGNAGVLAGVDLDKLSDVVLTSPGMGDSLVHNGTEFVNTHVDSIPSRIKQASLSPLDTYTLNETADVGRVVEVFNSGPTTINIPANDTFHAGTMIVIMQSGSGQVTVNYSTGTLNSTPGNKLRAQWSVATLLKRSEGSWLLYGDLVA